MLASVLRSGTGAAHAGVSTAEPKHLPVVSWYLKLDGAHGAMPNWGIVRVEISCDALSSARACDFGYLDRVSNALLHLRCRQGSYARAPVSMEPIVRGEESLKSLLSSPATWPSGFII